jgi:quinol monooxygenase YgiN
MAKLIVNHQVADFTKWKATFDALDPVRKKYGCQSIKVFQEQGNPRDVVIITSWGSKDQAKKYSESPELKEGLKNGGVVGAPSMYLLD